MTDVLAKSRDFMIASSKLPTMWALSADFDRLIALLEDPEQDAKTVEAIEVELRRVAGDIRTKAHGVATVIQALEGLSDFQKAAAKRMAEKAKANESHADRLKAYALECMKAIGQERIETGAYTLAVRVNPPSVLVTDAAAIPSEFNRTTITVTPDKLGIIANYKATGEIPPGVEIVRNESLRIS